MERKRFKAFLIRLFICLIVLSISYFAYQQVRTSKPEPVTPDRQLVDVQAKLNELYLRSMTLATFEADDPTTGPTVARLVSELSNTNDSLTRQATTASLLSPEQRQSIIAITALQTQAIKQYRANEVVLGRIVAFDPASDLGTIDPKQNAELLAARASAAQAGLNKAAVSTETTAAAGLAVSDQDGAPTIVTAATRTALQTQAGCFELLASQAQASSPQTSATRQRCIDAYPALRRQVVINLVQAAFNQDYIDKLKSLAVPLIDALKLRPTR